MTTMNRKGNYSVDIITKDDVFEMRKHDWNSLKRNIKKIPGPSKFISTIYSLLIGAGVSSGITLIPLYGTLNLKSWIIPFYILFTIFSILLGIILIIFDIKSIKNKKDLMNELEEDMANIEKLCKP